MRRLMAWLSGAAGGIAVYRLLTRRPTPALPPAPQAPDPRAEELRAKLEQQTDEQPVPEPAPEPEPEPEAAVDPDARRARVHERARAAADEMRRAGR